jgi:hypothetical protein
MSNFDSKTALNRENRSVSISIMDYSTFIDSEWSNAFEQGFSFFKEIPSTHVQSMIALIEANPSLLNLEFLKERAKIPGGIPKDTRMRIHFMQNEEQGRGDWLKYLPINHIKSMVANLLSPEKHSAKEDSEELQSLLERLKAEYESVRTPNAKETREAFFPELISALQVNPRNVGGGVWIFQIELEGKSMELALDFGGNYTTLTYWIDIYPDRKPKQTVFASYEKISGFGKPDWNLMRSDRLQHHSCAFVEVVSRTMRAISITMKG